MSRFWSVDSALKGRQAADRHGSDLFYWCIVFHVRSGKYGENFKKWWSVTRWLVFRGRDGRHPWSRIFCDKQLILLAPLFGVIGITNGVMESYGTHLHKTWIVPICYNKQNTVETNFRKIWKMIWKMNLIVLLFIENVYIFKACLLSLTAWNNDHN